MDFVKSNFPHNSPTPCALPMQLPYAGVLNDFQSHSVVNNICSFDRSMLVLLVSIGNIWIYQSFQKKKSRFLRFDDRVLWFFKDWRVQFDFSKLKNRITLYTENPWQCHEESMTFFFMVEIYWPINALYFCESIGFSRSIVDRATRLLL